MIALRPLVRLVGFLWLVALALTGLGVALYCVDGLISVGSARPDRLIGLAGVPHRVGGLLDQLAAPGSLAGLSLLCGVAAVLAGMLLSIGIFCRPRERLVLLDLDTQAGSLAARRTALRAMIRALVKQTNGVTNVKRPKLKPARRGTGGRVTVEVARARSADDQELQRSAGQALRSITDPFALKARVRVRLGDREARVH